MRPELTNAQEEVVYRKQGLFVVKACPGSGKTLTVAARLNRFLERWRDPHAGIAAMSFTNTAQEEVERYLVEQYGIAVPLGYPHFVGTIDSFVNRFIFLPFGHKVMRCTGRPVLTGPPHDDHEPIGNWLFWPKNAGECWKYCRLNSFSYDENGKIILVGRDPYRHFGRCSREHRDCSVLKVTFNRSRYATQADANYYAMKILEDFPDLARAIGRRFPVIIVDEAQDTSSIQMRILNALIRAGVSEVMLVGDPYQAIYEWRQAEPHLFENKSTEWHGNCVWLSENWRSTQSICDLACRLANSRERITAKNQDIAAYDDEPQLYGYRDESELPALLRQFHEHCSIRGIQNSNISVLTRSQEFINVVVSGAAPAPIPYPWRDGDRITKYVTCAKYLFDLGDFRDALAKLETAAYVHATGEPVRRHADIVEYARSNDFGRWRAELVRLLCELPKSEGLLSKWIVDANHIVRSSWLFRDCSLQIKRDWKTTIYSQIDFKAVFEAEATHPQTRTAAMGTVHSAKGRSLDAVFLALKSRGATGRNYVNLLGSPLIEHEELRIIYVAITRARKAIAIAVPQADLHQWQAYLLPAR